MVDIKIVENEVEIKLLGMHKIWALKNILKFQKSNISTVKIADKNLRPALIKWPGTYLPNLIAAGTFYGHNRKEFWDTTFKGKAIEIELSGDNYTKIIVDVMEPEQIITLLKGNLNR